MTKATERALLAALDTPALLLSGEMVEFANDSALALLGNHIVGQDVRIALRAPDAVLAIFSENKGEAKLSGLGASGSLYHLKCHRLEGTSLLVTLTDASIQISVARAHADFVANASHELRTPLASILGYLDALLDQNENADGALRKRFLTTMKHEACRMEMLVEDLMSLSRIEANKHELPETEIDLVEIAREAAQGSRAEVQTLNDIIPLQGDRTQLLQALRNLIENAQKYSSENGQILVSLEATRQGWALATVSDEGEGIAPEHLPRLTERFYRVSASRSREAGGTGLGLAIVKHIVERHRGRFDITSRPGVGTTASIMLPNLRQPG